MCSVQKQSGLLAWACYDQAPFTCKFFADQGLCSVRQLPPVAGDKGRGFVKSKSMLIALAEGGNVPAVLVLSVQELPLSQITPALVQHVCNKTAA